MLTLTALQLPARFGAFDEQLSLAERLLSEGPQTDLALLPELSLCGYVSASGDANVSRFAEPLDGPTVAGLRSLARRHGCAVVGPLVEKEGERLFNALVGVDPAGERWLHYRKRHPWYPETWATAGEAAHPLVHWRGLKLTAAICFDLHFVEGEGLAQLEAADVLLFASAWVADQADDRAEVLAGLSARHGCAVLNANWGRGVPAVKGQGGSLAVVGGSIQRVGEVASRLDVTVKPRVR